jgi:hypothetical protein
MKEKSFVYESDFDTNGIIYFLGTRNHTQPFKNPHTSGILKCQMSSILIGSHENIVSREKLSTCTRSQSSEWISIDFGSLSVQVTAYTLMHGYAGDKCNLREWTLEGSNDDKVWEVLSKHRDASLGGNFGTKTFTLDNNGFYRYLRVHTKHFFIQICGIEVYGNIQLAE